MAECQDDKIYSKISWDNRRGYLKHDVDDMYTLCFDKNICFGVTITDGTANILRVYFGANTMEVSTGILPYSSIDSMQFQLGVCIPSMENMICGLYIHQGDMTYIKFSRRKFQILLMLFFTSPNAPQFSLFPYMI